MTATHTMQPLEVGTLVIDPNGECENDGRIFSGGDVEIYPTEGPGPVAIVQGLEWAHLFADATAMRLALDMICAGVAEILTAEPPGFAPFREFKFGNECYALTDAYQWTWTSIITAIGWSRCLEALAAARGGV